MANLLSTTVNGSLLALNNGASNAYTTASNGRLYLGTNTQNDYSIYTHMESFNGNYTKLTLDWHTGIKIGASTSYGGIRFYSDAINNGGVKLFSVGEGDAHVRVENNLYVGNTIYNNGNAVVHAGNIGSQSVNYAASAGNSNTTSQIAFTNFKGNFPSGAGGGHYFANNHYSMGLDSGDGGWNSPHYRDLIIGYHTGVRIGANYSGIRFYNNSPTTDANNDGNGDGGEALLMTIGGYVGTASQTDVVVQNNLFANGSMRAPIFYDSDNTNYYLNPAGGSRLRNLYVGDSGDDWSDPGSWGTHVRFSNGPHVKFVLHARTPGIEAGMYVHTPGSVFMGSYTAHVLSLMYAGNMRMQVEDSRIYSNVYMESASSMRAPIFYDSNDTTYYLDPDSTSRSFRGRGEILLGPNSAGQYTRIGGNGGSVDHATMSASNGNLHIDCKDTFGLYLNYYSRDTIYLGQGATITSDGTYYNGTSANSNLLDSIDSSGFVRAYGTTNDNIDSDWGQSFKTFDPVPAGTPPIESPNLRTINIGENFDRRTQLAFNYNTDQAWFRRRDSVGWKEWREFIHSGNIGSQSVNYAGSAGAVDWSNVSGKPSTFAPDAHNHDADYINVGGDTMTGLLKLNAGITNDNWSTFTHLQGAWSVGNASGTGGAIRIELPVSEYNTNTMMSMTIKVYEYSTGKSFTLFTGGYNYNNSSWYNCFATLVGDNQRGDVPVYFGHDGTRNVIWIGNPDWSWSYPNVWVTDFQSGHTQGKNWNDGWRIVFDQQAPVNVTTSETAHQQISTANIASQSVNYAGSAGAVAWSNVSSKPSTFAPDAHNHNDIYYTETEVDTLLGTKAASSHTHSIGSITDAARWWNNFGDNHNTRTTFDAQGAALTTGYGWRYVQGNENGPGTDSSPNQFYALSVGLGNDYTNYGMQLVIPRNTAKPYISVRFDEGNSLGAWQKISAGYADTAGAVPWSGVSGIPSTFSPSAHNHNDIYYTETEVDTLLSGKLGSTAKAADSEAVDGIDSSRIVYGNGPSKINSHSNANEYRDSGFYENDGGGLNWPSQTWYNSINVRHSNQGNYHGFQVAMSYYDNNLWFRSYQGSGTFQNWAYAISSENIGSQSVNYASSAGAVAWSNVSGKPSTFSPSAHTHTPTEVGLSSLSSNGNALAGNFTATGDITAYSDSRIKENVTTIDSALDKVMSLRGVEYNKIGSEEKSLGVIAQEIREVLPEVVKEQEDGMLSVAYGNITAVLIEALKEQQKQIDELKAQIDAITK